MRLLHLRSQSEMLVNSMSGDGWKQCARICPMHFSFCPTNWMAILPSPGAPRTMEALVNHLCRLAREGDVDTCWDLLEEGCDPNRTDKVCLALLCFGGLLEEWFQCFYGKIALKEFNRNGPPPGLFLQRGCKRNCAWVSLFSFFRWRIIGINWVVTRAVSILG